MRTVYAFSTNDNDEGEYEFCISTQSCFVSTLSALNKEINSHITEFCHTYDPPYTRAEAVDELDIRKYKLQIEEIT